jgi:hypothetical protein
MTSEDARKIKALILARAKKNVQDAVADGQARNFSFFWSCLFVIWLKETMD